MKLRLARISYIVAALTLLALFGLAVFLPACSPTTGDLAPGVPVAITAGTSLAVNLYPAAAPLVESFAGGIRAATAKGPVAPAALNAFLAPYATAGEAFVGKVSVAGEADVKKFVAAIESKYAALYPKLQTGEITVEQFAQAVEQGA